MYMNVYVYLLFGRKKVLNFAFVPTDGVQNSIYIYTHTYKTYNTYTENTYIHIQKIHTYSTCSVYLNVGGLGFRLKSLEFRFLIHIYHTCTVYLHVGGLPRRSGQKIGHDDVSFARVHIPGS